MLQTLLIVESGAMETTEIERPIEKIANALATGNPVNDVFYNVVYGVV